QNHEDFVLSNICSMIINRDLLKVKLKNKKHKIENVNTYKDRLMKQHNISAEEASYFVFTGEITNQAYQLGAQHINILYKSGKIQDIVKASDQLNLKALSKPVTKFYICYPKE